MDTLKRLFKRGEERSELSHCPYCGLPVEVIPRTSGICPHCGQQVFARKGALVTKTEDESAVWIRRTAGLGGDEPRYEETRAHLAKEGGCEPPWHDVARAVLTNLIAEHTEREDYLRVPALYRELALILSADGEDPRQSLREAAKWELISMKWRPVVWVMIDGVRDRESCPACRRLRGTRVAIYEALATLPVPNVCTRAEGCRCRYLPFFLPLE